MAHQQSAVLGILRWPIWCIPCKSLLTTAMRGICPAKESFKSEWISNRSELCKNVETLQLENKQKIWETRGNAPWAEDSGFLGYDFVIFLSRWDGFANAYNQCLAMRLGKATGTEYFRDKRWTSTVSYIPQNRGYKNSQNPYWILTKHQANSVPECSRSPWFLHGFLCFFSKHQSSDWCCASCWAARPGVCAWQWARRAARRGGSWSYHPPCHGSRAPGSAPFGSARCWDTLGQLEKDCSIYPWRKCYLNGYDYMNITIWLLSLSFLLWLLYEWNGDDSTSTFGRAYFQTRMAVANPI